MVVDDVDDVDEGMDDDVEEEGEGEVEEGERDEDEDEGFKSSLPSS